KIVYGLALGYYPLYIGWQLLVLRRLPQSFRIFLDPLLMNHPAEQPWNHTADWVNHLAIDYTADILLNRLIVILAAASCLTFLCLRFAIGGRRNNSERFTLLRLSTSSVSHTGSFALTSPSKSVEPLIETWTTPDISQTNEPSRSHFSQLFAALAIELRL